MSDDDDQKRQDKVAMAKEQGIQDGLDGLTKPGGINFDTPEESAARHEGLAIGMAASNKNKGKSD